MASLSEDLVCKFLSDSLARIPVPTSIKEKKVLDNQKVSIVERVIIRDTTIGEMLINESNIEVDQALLKPILYSTLLVLRTLGIINLANQQEETPNLLHDQIRVAATSEPAGYLIQTLCIHLAKSHELKSPITPDSSIFEFRSIITSALEINQLNPHLVLSNIFERNRKNSSDKHTLRQSRVISALIKGTRKDKVYDENINVFLHVWKPKWDSYALIGSVQNASSTDIETAKLALQEDTYTSIESFQLTEANIADEYINELSVSRGVITQYAFNLVIVETLHDELILRDELEYAWLSVEEIIEQKALTGERIITNPKLIQKLGQSRDFNSIPTIINNVDQKLQRTFRHYFYRFWKEFLEFLLAFLRLLYFFWLRIWSIKWWVIGLLISGFLFFIFRPFSPEGTSLGYWADVLTIAGFFISLIGTMVSLWSISRKP